MNTATICGMKSILTVFGFMLVLSLVIAVPLISQAKQNQGRSAGQQKTASPQKQGQAAPTPTPMKKQQVVHEEGHSDPDMGARLSILKDKSEVANNVLSLSDMGMKPLSAWVAITFRTQKKKDCAGHWYYRVVTSDQLTFSNAVSAPQLLNGFLDVNHDGLPDYILNNLSAVKTTAPSSKSEAGFVIQLLRKETDLEHWKPTEITDYKKTSKETVTILQIGGETYFVRKELKLSMCKACVPVDPGNPNNPKATIK